MILSRTSVKNALRDAGNISDQTYEKFSRILIKEIFLQLIEEMLYLKHYITLQQGTYEFGFQCYYYNVSMNFRIL